MWSFPLLQLCKLRAALLAQIIKAVLYMDLACLWDFSPHEKGSTSESLPFLQLALQNTGAMRVAGSGTAYKHQPLQRVLPVICGCTKVVFAPLQPEVCLLPQIIQPDLESTREPSCISTRVLFRLLLFKSFFSLSFPSYHAACPTGTTLMPENRLDNIFYEQAKRGLKPFCTRLPANQQQGQGQSQGPRSPSHTFSSALPSITGRFEERHNSISLESGGRNRESKEGGLNGKEFTNTTGTRIFLLQ